MPSCSDGTHSCCFETNFHVPNFSPFSAERKFRFGMKTCPSVGLKQLGKKMTRFTSCRGLFAFQEVFGVAQRSCFQQVFSSQTAQHALQL